MAGVNVRSGMPMGIEAVHPDDDSRNVEIVGICIVLSVWPFHFTDDTECNAARLSTSQQKTRSTVSSAAGSFTAV